MNRRSLLLAPAALFLGALPALAQSQVEAVAVDPNDSGTVWTVNRENNSVAVVDVDSGTLLSEITVGVWPRSLAFNADGSLLLVANQRGNVPVTTHFITPFTGTEIRGSVSVIDTATKTVVNTLTDVGTEPYGIVLSPNGKYFTISSMRSAEMIFLDATTLSEVARFQYDWDMNFITSGTIADVDEDFDGIPDLQTPRAFSIAKNSKRVYVTHLKSPWVSVLSVALDGSGVPTGVTLDSKIQQDDYPFHPINNPTPVHVIKSQGTPRFSDDIALDPNDRLALVPQQLHNVNHDPGFNYGPNLAGDFANRVYPSLTVLDLQNGSFGQPGDRSNRLHHELADTDSPAEYVPFGKGGASSVGVATLGGVGSPIVGTTATFRVSGAPTGSNVVAWFGPEMPVPITSPGLFSGSLLVTNNGLFPLFDIGGGVHAGSTGIANNPALVGTAINVQAAIIKAGEPVALTNGLRAVIGTEGYGLNKMGRRAGLPSKALFSPDGKHVLMLNRGSEDVFLYDYDKGNMTLRATFPPRYDFQERTPLDTTTPMGDLPLGWTLAPDAGTSNDDALIYVMNELTRTLSVLRVDWSTGVISQAHSQISTHTGPDLQTLSERVGEELFEDASRAQTTAGFNNSCASCHFEGGEDGNVWQRTAGPRSTIAVYGGPLLTGLGLWKGVRINLGETGPMFGGENGGHGVLTDAQQQGLDDFAKIVPVPLNPFWDPVTNDLTAQAAMGRDLFFGTNDTGTNPTGRHPGCFTCHPKEDPVSGDPRGMTADFVSTLLTDGLDFGVVHDPTCFSLQGNIVAVNVRNVNSGVNVDENEDTVPDNDRNFDGYSDLESYTPMYVDDDDNFTRDDPNSYPCLLDPFDPFSGQKLFLRQENVFSIPTKLGVVTSGPYMHDHSLVSLRAVVDPSSQMTDPVYGNAAYPTTFKFFNEFHDIRSHEDIVPNVSKTKITLNPTNVQDDIDKILAFIVSL
ncbi:MAG: beta-propeller fold lactonase family protein [Planctomycetota bacterium]